jgi:predicted dehydrogenase
VLVEKPICQTEAEFGRITDALARKPDLVFQSNLILRRSPRLQELKKTIAEGDLGQLFYIEADYAYGRMHKITEGWRGQIPFYSVTAGGGIHMIDTILWLTGGAVVEVQGCGNRIATRDSPFRYDDFQVALLRMENNVIAKVASNFGCVYPHSHLFALYGTRASYVQNVLGAAMVTSRDPEAVPRPITTTHNVAKGAFIPRILQAIMGQAEPEISRREILEAMRVCLAIERAIGEKRTVQVNTIGSQ